MTIIEAEARAWALREAAARRREEAAQVYEALLETNAPAEEVWAWYIALAAKEDQARKVWVETFNAYQAHLTKGE